MLQYLVHVTLKEEAENGPVTYGPFETQEQVSDFMFAHGTISEFIFEIELVETERRSS